MDEQNHHVLNVNYYSKIMTTSLVREYLNLYNSYKAQYGTTKCVLFMQVGGFYEVYSTLYEDPDVQTLAGTMNVQHTRKNKSIKEISEKNPYLLGFPCAALKKYVRLLVDVGFVVVVYDQLNGNGNITRQKKAVYSPGTFIDDVSVESSVDALPSGLGCLLCVYQEDADSKPVYCNMNTLTGEGSVLLATGHDAISRYVLAHPFREIVTTQTGQDAANEWVTYNNNNTVNVVPRQRTVEYQRVSYQNAVLEKAYGVDSLMMSPIERLGLERYPDCVAAWTMLLDFAYEHNPRVIENLALPKLVEDGGDTLLLETGAAVQLGIVGGKYSVSSMMESLCSTRPGVVFMRQQLLCPLTSSKHISERYDAVEDLSKCDNKKALVSHLKSLPDLERFHRRLTLGIISFQDLLVLRNAYLAIKDIITTCLGPTNPFWGPHPNPQGIVATLDQYFCFDEGREHPFQRGVYPEVDDLCEQINLQKDSVCVYKDRLVKLLSLHDPRSTGDAIKLNDSLEMVCTPRRASILEDALQKMSLVTKAFYGSLEFQKKSSTSTIIRVTGKDNNEIHEKLTALICKYWTDACKSVSRPHVAFFQQVSGWVARVDFSLTTLIAAQNYKYTRPQVCDKEQGPSFLEATKLRHPIVERLIHESGSSKYVSHDITIGDKGILLYGINSSGKSVIMKATGIAVVMAQAGLYVPCSSLTIQSPFQSLFTRISGDDNLGKGLSSFTVEMSELGTILNRAGPRSLVLGDELCHTTETTSGCAIIVASLMMLHQKRVRYLFASHLHAVVERPEIQRLGLRVYHLSSHIDKDKIIFDRQLLPGVGSKVYGVDVARHLIQNEEFHYLTECVMKRSGRLIDGSKPSRYNRNVYMTECEECGERSALQTHHITHQSECTEDGFFDEHHHKNSRHNLKVLCSKCHKEEHSLETSHHVKKYV